MTASPARAVAPAAPAVSAPAELPGALPVRCVVFDVDDTLYLERDYVRSGFTAVGRWVDEHLGVAGFADTAWRAFVAGVRGRVFDTALSTLGVRPTPDLVADLVAVYRSHEPDVRLLPDALVCLRRLAGTVGVAIVTDGPPASQRTKVRALGLDRWAHPIVLTSDLGQGYGKPHPRAFATVERVTGVPGSACAYVADNPAKDFTGPRGRGWRTIRVRRPGGLHHGAPSGPGVDHELASLASLPELLSPEQPAVAGEASTSPATTAGPGPGAPP